MKMEQESRENAGRKARHQRVALSGAVLACVAALSVSTQAAAETLVTDATTVTDAIYNSSLLNFVLPDAFAGATVERKVYSSGALQGQVIYKTGTHPSVNMVIFDVFKSIDGSEEDYAANRVLDLTNISNPVTYSYTMSAASGRDLLNKCFHVAIDPTATSQDMVCQVREEGTQTVIKTVLSGVQMKTEDDLDWAKRESFDMIRIARETLAQTVYSGIAMARD